MAKILIEVSYKPNLKHYPTHDDDGNDLKHDWQAMLFDCRQIEEGEGDIGPLLDNDMKIVGVEDDNGVLHKL